MIPGKYGYSRTSLPAHDAGGALQDECENGERARGGTSGELKAALPVAGAAQTAMERPLW